MKSTWKVKTFCENRKRFTISLSNDLRCDLWHWPLKGLRADMSKARSLHSKIVKTFLIHTFCFHSLMIYKISNDFKISGTISYSCNILMPLDLHETSYDGDCGAQSDGNILLRFSCWNAAVYWGSANLWFITFTCISATTTSVLENMHWAINNKDKKYGSHSISSSILHSTGRSILYLQPISKLTVWNQNIMTRAHNK